MNTNFEEWLAYELFDYLMERELLPENAEFEDWKHNRDEMIEICKEDENNQL